MYNYTDGLHNASALPVDVEEKTRRGHSYKLNKKSVPPLEYRNSSPCELSAMPGTSSLIGGLMLPIHCRLTPVVTCAGIQCRDSRALATSMIDKSKVKATCPMKTE